MVSVSRPLACTTLLQGHFPSLVCCPPHPHPHPHVHRHIYCLDSFSLGFRKTPESLSPIGRGIVARPGALKAGIGGVNALHIKWIKKELASLEGDVLA